MTVAGRCPACAEPAATADRYCEACGHDLTTAAVADRWVSSAGLPAPCACGSTAPGTDGYCDDCGLPRAVAPDRSAVDLGTAAAVTDRGLHHRRNEDAVALGATGGAAFAVVCDGVSTTDRPDAAAHAAVAVAATSLLHDLGGGGTAGAAITSAAGAAQTAVARLGGATAAAASCTFVCAVASAQEVTVGWVGDSRAYWVPTSGPAAGLTVDDSLAEQLAAAGTDERTAAEHPHAAALVCWLGADATESAPHLRRLAPDGPGHVVVCSDGLSRYPGIVAALPEILRTRPPRAAARHLVQAALAAGGHDNITVAVLAWPPQGADR
ncbi:protein phosphatase 2C domain-containing protein [Dactylosporangium sp. AC04546]|uniref:PP2C family protein-serine/threonine phosphatase n=1 Tax=Dactylosporangium sp. AC04546 TaxID=2862460 RepID=UPI001EDD2C81|nr:protein phosphatase 2C domain-containing protein [Dactylosporangium sp. AC04546]WVK78840.1 protein phosphatase 2C domain-containing protein [Dactylosporangium sp. AC04546]